MNQSSVIKKNCVSFTEIVQEDVLFFFEEIGQALKSGIEFLWSGKREWTLLRRGIVYVGDLSVSGERCLRRRGEGDCGAVLVYVMAIMDVMERHWGFSQDIEISRVGLPQALGGVDAVDGYRCSTYRLISKAMQDLELGRVFKISKDIRV